jgi:hypothetical protein
MKKICAVVAGVTFFFSTISAPLVEANYWQERREAVQARQSTKTLYAMGPSGAGALAEALPFLDGQVSGGVELGSLSGASLPLAHSSLTAEQVKSLPAWLNGISSAHGSISQAYFAPEAAKRPLVVHIQDVHEHQEAQLNISALINDVVQTGAVTLVGLEGAVGAFDLAPYRSFPNKTVINDVADFMVQEHMIGGGEHAGWTAEKTPTLWGVEELGIYLKNINSFKDALPAQQRVQDRIKNWQFRLAQVKPAVFSAKLKNFDDNQARFRAGTLSLPEFMDLLGNTGKVQASQYPSLVAFQKCLVMEKSLNFSLVEKDRGILVKQLTQALSEKEISQLVQQTLLYRAGKMSHGAYYDSLQTFCERKGVSFAKFPAMAAYIKYVLAAEQIQPEILLNELDAIQVDVASSLVRTPEEQAVHDLSQDLIRLTSLAEFKMSPRDWADYERHRARILDTATRMDRLAPGGDPYGGDLLKDLVPFEGFCQAALARDKTLIENLLAKMEEGNQKAAVLLAGGFHTVGMTDLLQKNKVSYVVFTPTFTTIESDSHYLDFLKDRPALEKLFTQDRITTKVPILTGNNATPGYEGGAQAVRPFLKATFAAAASAIGETLPDEVTAISPAAAIVDNYGNAAVSSVESSSGRHVTVAAQQGAEAPQLPAETQVSATYNSSREGGVSFTVAVTQGSRSLFATVRRWAQSFFPKRDRGDGGEGTFVAAAQPAGAHRWVVGLLMPLARRIHGEERALDMTIRFYAPMAEALMVLGVWALVVNPLWALLPVFSPDLFTQLIMSQILPFAGLNMLFGFSHREGYKFQGGKWTVVELTWRERAFLGLSLFSAHAAILLGWMFVPVAMGAHVWINYLAKTGWFPVAGALGGGTSDITDEQIKLADRFLVQLAYAQTDEETKSLEREFPSLGAVDAQNVKKYLSSRIKELQRIGIFHRTRLFINWAKFMIATSQSSDGTISSQVENILGDTGEQVLRTYTKKHEENSNFRPILPKDYGEFILNEITVGNAKDAAHDFLILTAELSDDNAIRVLDAIVPNLANQAVANRWESFIQTLKEAAPEMNQKLSETYSYGPRPQLITVLTGESEFPEQLKDSTNIPLLVSTIQNELDTLRNLPPGANKVTVPFTLNEQRAALLQAKSQFPLLSVPARTNLNVAMAILEDAFEVRRAIINGTPIPSSPYFTFPAAPSASDQYIARFQATLSMNAEESRQALNRLANDLVANNDNLAVMGNLYTYPTSVGVSSEVYYKKLGELNIALIALLPAPIAQGGHDVSSKLSIVNKELENLLKLNDNAADQSVFYQRILDEQSEDALEILQGIANRIPQANAASFQTFIDLTLNGLISAQPGKVVDGQGDKVIIALPVKVLSFAEAQQNSSPSFRSISLRSLLTTLMGRGDENGGQLPSGWIEMGPRQMAAWLAYATPAEREAGMNELRNNLQQARVLLGAVVIDAAAAHANGVSYRTGQSINEEVMHEEMQDLGRLALWLGFPLDAAQKAIDETYNMNRTLVDYSRGTRKNRTLEQVYLEDSSIGHDGITLTPGADLKRTPVALFTLPLVKDPATGKVTWQSGVDEKTQKLHISQINSKVAAKVSSVAIFALDQSLTAEEIQSFLETQTVATGQGILHVMGSELKGLYRADGTMDVEVIGAALPGEIGVQMSPNQKWYEVINLQIYTSEPAALYLGRYWNVVNVLLLIAGEIKKLDLDQYDNKVERYLKIQA